jgi:hypothetical protein
MTLRAGCKQPAISLPGGIARIPGSSPSLLACRAGEGDHAL